MKKFRKREVVKTLKKQIKQKDRIILSLELNILREKMGLEVENFRKLFDDVKI